MRVIRLTVLLSASLVAAAARAQPGVPPMEPQPAPKAPAAQPAPPAPPPPAPPPPAAAQPAPAPPPAAAQPPPPAPAPPPPAAQPAPAPPPPPAAQAAPAAPPVEPAPLAPVAPIAAVAPAPPEEAPGLAGWHGSFYLRDSKDIFRFYPRGRLHVDFNTFFGPGVHDVAAADGGNLLKSKLFLRRLRLELSGEFLERFQFQVGVDFGGQGLSNANGKTQTAAGSAGDDPTASSARFAGVQTQSTTPSIADTYINYRLFPELNIMFGQEKTPFSMEVRTSSNSTTPLDRTVAMRSFASNDKEIGITLWGDVGKNKLLSYEAGIYGGDGRNRPQVDNRADFIGRVVVRPMATMGKGPLEKAHVGMSARHGERDPDYVGYNYNPITTGQGWTLWDPRYRDEAGRTTHVIPSGAQNSIGGELRLPVMMLDLRGELYYVANRTREAIDGFQLTNTERLGAVTGLAWYAQLSAWLWGDTFVTGDPGYVRPVRVDFDKKPELKRGLEVFALIAGIDAGYDGASREGDYDPNTPGAAGVASDITVRQYGIGANYWYTKHVRATINYNLYHVPGSDTADNLALAPGNAADRADAHHHHELGTRLGVQF